jgi:hypothetical protein
MKKNMPTRKISQATGTDKAMEQKKDLACYTKQRLTCVHCKRDSTVKHVLQFKKCRFTV